MGRPLDQGHGPKNHGRHKQNDSNQADYNSLGQHDSHIKPNAELHKSQHDKAHDGRQAAGENGAERLVDSVSECLPLLNSLLFFPGVGVNQENGVIHGNCQLQYSRHAVRQEGNPAQKNIGALINKDRHSHDGQIEHRLKPGIGGNTENQKNHQDAQSQNHVHFPADIFFQRLVLHSRTCKVSLIPQNLHHRVNGLRGFLAGISLHKGHVHDRRPVFIIICNIAAVDKAGRRVDVCPHIQPQNLIHSVHSFQLILVKLCLIESHILNHHPGGSWIAEFLLHQIQPLLRLHCVRQVLRQVVIDLHKGSRNHRQNHQNEKQLFNGSALFQDKIRKTELRLFSCRRSRKLHSFYF